MKLVLQVQEHDSNGDVGEIYVENTPLLAHFLLLWLNHETTSSDSAEKMRYDMMDCLQDTLNSQKNTKSH